MDNIIRLESFKIAGISVRTTNQDGKSAIDIGALWQRFYSEDISSKISEKTGNDIYSVYTDYELDYTGGYTTLIGHRVTSLDNMATGVDGREFEGGNYIAFTAKGTLPEAVIKAWQEIWEKDKELHRAYTADFEVYRKQSVEDENSEVEIYIATG